MNILLEEQAKIGRIIKKTIWGILPLVSLSLSCSHVTKISFQ